MSGGEFGLVEIASLDEGAALAALERGRIARALPPDRDYVAPLGPQNYEDSRRYVEATGTLGMEVLAARAGEAIAQGVAAGVDTFGCAASGRRFLAMVNSAGLFPLMIGARRSKSRSPPATAPSHLVGLGRRERV